MLSRAKETAFNGVRPYLPRGGEPELALFMLVTLPVLTVALRAADENYRRPKPPPLPPGYRPPRPPRTVRFPNSPAKVDAEAAAEARKAREAEEDIKIVKALRQELAAKAPIGAAAAAAAGTGAASPPALGGATAVPEETAAAVVEAVAADPDAVVAELSRLRRELAAAGRLAAKVEALERANARLVGQVADLSRQPSPEAVRLSVEKEATR
ncbi:unnamed protein product, partial [Hapterophycus canaliculatus]